jgi:hypothetical protein
VTDAFGGSRFLEEGNQWIPVPPAVDIPLDAVRAVASGDGALLSDTVARLVPGGVALNKAYGLSPRVDESTLPGRLLGNLQKTYVGWDQNVNGYVPVFSGDGRLVDWKSPTEIAARALGVDMGAWSRQGSLDTYIVAQRDLIRQYERKYIEALHHHEYGRAEAIQQEHLRKFKIPLTVSEQQVKGYFDSQAQTRTERVLDQIPVEYRQMYAEMAARQGALPIVSRDAFLSAQSASGRERNPIDPRIVEEVMRRANVGPAATTTSGAFSPFPGFGQ